MIWKLQDNTKNKLSICMKSANSTLINKQKMIRELTETND